MANDVSVTGIKKALLAVHTLGEWLSELGTGKKTVTKQQLEDIKALKRVCAFGMTKATGLIEQYHQSNEEVPEFTDSVHNMIAAIAVLDSMVEASNPTPPQYIVEN